MDASLFYAEEYRLRFRVKVKRVSKIAGEYHYYTLSMQMKDKMVSCPVMNVEGQVFGISQKSSGADTITNLLCGRSGFCDVAED